MSTVNTLQKRSNNDDSPRILMTQEEWNFLDPETQYDLIYGDTLSPHNDTSNALGCEQEYVHQEPVMGQLSSGYYIEVGPKSLTLHIHRRTFHWIDEVK
jgi:hypothetical protein